MPKTLSVLKRKAQAAGANKPKKKVRFYPVVKNIYYDKLKMTSGGLQRVEYGLCRVYGI